MTYPLTKEDRLRRQKRRKTNTVYRYNCATFRIKRKYKSLFAAAKDINKIHYKGTRDSISMYKVIKSKIIYDEAIYCGECLAYADRYNEAVTKRKKDLKIRFEHKSKASKRCFGKNQIYKEYKRIMRLLHYEFITAHKYNALLKDYFDIKLQKAIETDGRLDLFEHLLGIIKLKLLDYIDKETNELKSVIVHSWNKYKSYGRYKNFYKYRIPADSFYKNISKIYENSHKYEKLKNN